MTMKDYKRIYVSDDVIVQLTEEGIHSLCYYFGVDNLKDLKKKLGNFLDAEALEFRAPLGDLINIFGADIFSEGFEPFKDGCVYIPKKSLK